MASAGDCMAVAAGALIAAGMVAFRRWQWERTLNSMDSASSGASSVDGTHPPRVSSTSVPRASQREPRRVPTTRVAAASPQTEHKP